MKKLVVYYSLSGNTRAVAKRIARTLRADLMEIRTVKSYPDDYDVLLSLGQKEIRSGYMPHRQSKNLWPASPGRGKRCIPLPHTAGISATRPAISEKQCEGRRFRLSSVSVLKTERRSLPQEM